MALRLHIRGTVQGVGFRPHVYQLAVSMKLAGFVANTDEGVVIEVEGPNEAAFPGELKRTAPPLARIMEMRTEEIAPESREGFRIERSRDGLGFTLLSPDMATCPDCLRELRDPSDRRHGYPFINCTNCGPRYSITLKTPYDRPNTTMQAFTMCGRCMAEYENPASRRFHAVPNACPGCGPSLTLISKDGSRIKEGALLGAIALLREGRILAIKGLGGFHLACDARNEAAVNGLRRRKRKSNKPFALMARSLDIVSEHCYIPEQDAGLLTSQRRPIVLLQKRQDSKLPEALAPMNRRLGWMLPYTPLHYLIMDELGLAVMTSGNRAEEPMESSNESAMESLGALADAWLVHDRDIFMRVDDSVVRSAPVEGGAAYIRRARGFAPEAIPMAEDGPDILAVGGDLKNTFTLMKSRSAIVSQHIGDMENYETMGFFEETLRNLQSVYRAEPVAIAHDLHPEYHSTRWAIAYGASRGLRLQPVQHHHAHIASVMAERGITGKVIGVALDGTGYGPDMTIWGGEFMLVTPVSYERLGRFQPVAMPGGDAAAREPWRMAASYIHAIYGNEAEARLRGLGFHARYGESNVSNLIKLLGAGGELVMTSSAGRLFDAVSAMLGLVGVNTFEGEAAIALEAMAEDGVDDDYAFDIATTGNLMELDFTFTLIAILNDLSSGVPKGCISAKFHNTVSAAITRMAGMLARRTGVETIALSGGVFQNPRLLEHAVGSLTLEDMLPITNSIVPPNDGGVSLGQAYILRNLLQSS